jgi:hypothetical protein
VFNKPVKIFTYRAVSATCATFQKGESYDIKGTTLARVFEIRLLRPAREEVTEGWRKLHNNVSSFVTL